MALLHFSAISFFCQIRAKDLGHVFVRQGLGRFQLDNQALVLHSLLLSCVFCFFAAEFRLCHWIGVTRQSRIKTAVADYLARHKRPEKRKASA